jgi:hypothetical protein
VVPEHVGERTVAASPQLRNEALADAILLGRRELSDRREALPLLRSWIVSR